MSKDILAADDLNVDAAIRMAETVIAKTSFEKGQKPQRYNFWMYQNHIIGEGMKALGKALNRSDFESFYQRNLLFYREAHGEVKHNSQAWYEKPRTMWQCGMIAGFVELQKTDPHPEIERAMGIFQKLLDEAPKVTDGCLARNKGKWKSNCIQIDDLYMVTPYWVRKAQLTDELKYLEMAIKEALSYFKHLWNPESKLMHCLWVDKTQTAIIPHWGRGNGWYVMGITDLLDFVPENHPKRTELISNYRTVMSGLMERQSSSGLWHQVLDKPESYTETSCSGMFTYSLLRGAAQGWLPEEARAAGLKGWAGLQTKLNDDNELTDVCVGTDMSEDFEYYFNRPRKIHDQHGVGPYLLAASEIAKLNN
ncbi:MAG: glycoside hydrolase family 88 protein [Verrucomicrobiota bacterium]